MLQRVAEAVRGAVPRVRRTPTALNVALGTVLLLGVGALILWRLQRYVTQSATAADRVQFAQAGVAVVLALGFLLLWLWVHPILRWVGPGKRHSLTFAGVIAIVVVILLTTQARPNAAALDLSRVFRGPDSEAAFDIVLVVDPSDPGVRRLVRTARESPTALVKPLPIVADQSVRLGIIAVRPARPGQPIWRVLLPVTENRANFVRTLSALPIDSSAQSAAGSYPEAVYQASGPLSLQVGWQSDTERLVVLVADRLPSRTELDATFHRYLALLDEGKLGIPPGLRKVARNPEFGILPVPWENALRRISLKPFIPGIDPVYSLSVVTMGTADSNLGAWRRWTTRARGEVLLSTRFQDVRSALDVAELAAVGYPSRRVQRLAERFRPFLFFDTNERFRVLDVREFLRESETDGTARHKICERRLLASQCRSMRSSKDIRSTDDYLDIGDRPTDERPIQNSGVIYYDVRPMDSASTFCTGGFFGTTSRQSGLSSTVSRDSRSPSGRASTTRATGKA